MQTPTLLNQLTASPPAPAPARQASSPNANGAQFSQALSREVAQRQAPSAPGSAPAAAPAQPANGAKGAATQSPARTDKPQAAAKPAADSAKPATGKSAKADSDKPEDSAAAAQAAANTPVIDMLALVASFNQPVQATPDGAAAEAAGPQLAAGAELPRTEALLAQAGGLQLSAAVPPQAKADGAAATGEADAPGAQLLPLETAVDGKAALAKDADAAGASYADAARQAASISADKAAAPKEAIEQFTMKEVQAAPSGSAPVQQAALTQAVANGAGDKIAARVGTPAWDNQVSQKIVWMVAGKEQSATLTLNPPDLGPMQVVLSVTNDQANVTFTAAQPEVRQALEDAMPRLREMMSESGLSLGNASVNAGASDQRQAQGEASGGRGGNGFGGGAVEERNDNGSASAAAARVVARPMRASGLAGVDTFA
jgi:flagellar hook-length control protein FliK